MTLKFLNSDSHALSIASFHQSSTSVPHLGQLTPDQFPQPQWNSVLSENFARTSYASGTKVFRSSTALSAAALDGSASGSVGMKINQLSDIELKPTNWARTLIVRSLGERCAQRTFRVGRESGQCWLRVMSAVLAMHLDVSGLPPT